MEMSTIHVYLQFIMNPPEIILKFSISDLAMKLMPLSLMKKTHLKSRTPTLMILSKSTAMMLLNLMLIKSLLTVTEKTDLKLTELKNSKILFLLLIKMMSIISLVKKSPTTLLMEMTTESQKSIPTMVKLC
jgi:hypothetical protein